MNERIFAIAHYVDQGVLYLLLALCFFSIFMIFERFSYLKKKVKHSKIRQKELKAILESQDYARLEKLTTDLNEVEDRAIHLSLEHYKKYNKSGVDEYLNM